MQKLVVKNLSKTFQGKKILDNLNFTVEDGEFLSILGPSGCGKTTLLRILIGLMDSDDGIILKDGVDITQEKPSNRKMGIVFQNYALFPNMTVLENVEYALRFNEETKKNSREIAKELVHQVGLSEHMYKKPNKLSGGQQQRVAIARTLALNPEVILFDEPMSSLDASMRLTLRDEIKKIQAQFKTTIIFITHDQEESFTMSDRVMVMSEGKIEQIDTPENIIKEPANEYVTEFVINNLNKKISSLIKYVE